MPTLLLLHGWGGSAASMAPLVDYFARDYQVLVPDLPCPPAGKVYHLADYVDDLQAYLRAHQVTHCDVIAHSFGARLLALLNQRQPDLVGKMVVTGGAGPRPRWSFRVWWQIRWYKLRKKLFGHASGGSKEYRQLDHDGKQTFQNVVNTDLSAVIAQIKVPLLLIWGQQDRATPLSMLRRWQRLVPHAQTLVYRHCGHFAYLESTARFLKDVTAFFTGGAHA